MKLLRTFLKVVLVNDHGVHTDFRGGCRVRKVVIALVDGIFHIFCVRFVTLFIYEETHDSNGFHMVSKCAREESEESEEFHFINVQVKSISIFCRGPRSPYDPSY